MSINSLMPDIDTLIAIRTDEDVVNELESHYNFLDDELWDRIIPLSIVPLKLMHMKLLAGQIHNTLADELNKGEGNELTIIHDNGSKDETLLLVHKLLSDIMNGVGYTAEMIDENVHDYSDDTQLFGLIELNTNQVDE